MEVVQGLLVMEDSGYMDRKSLSAIKSWFEEYITWLTTHQYGKDEMNAENNHGTCWTMQVAAFAKFTGNKKVLEFCSNRFKTVLLPNQMDKDGSFSARIKSGTKPYGYSIFNLDAMVTLCQVLLNKTG